MTISAVRMVVVMMGSLFNLFFGIQNKKFALLDKLKPLREKERACWAALQGKRTEMEPFSMALNKFRSAQGNANSNARGKGQDICSSEEELNERVNF